ncbi:uncharacterized protein etaa1b [Alosa pseudoharengus]|uniref:uncharacterized protein etaa1b n=1 Tax=Alosa pseudoharengus TaxID=34774 RepID=UPI003F88ABEE
MENRKNLDARRTPNAAGKSLQRVRLCRHPHERTNANVNVNINNTNIRQAKAKWLKQSQSPSPDTALSHHRRKAFETPKRSKLRSSDCSHGDSPDAVHDIIWEPASPPSVWNEKGSKKSEILDIVNRIAPKEGGHESRDSPVLGWIEDGTIRCTPDVPAPRPRRISTRQNSVEDLKKLAREFDLRINKEQQETGSDGHPASPEQPQGGQAAVLDAELNALFDAPTQHLSRRLSQSSSISSQESKANLASAVVDRGNSGPKKGSGVPSTVADKPAESSESVSGKGDFDDDWENDDLLDDSFVLEMTQNPVVLDGVPATISAAAITAPCPPPRLPVSKAGDPVIKANPSVSARMAACGQAGPSGGRGGGGSSATGVPSGPRSKPATSANPSTFMAAPSGNSLSKNTTTSEPRKPCFKATDAGKHEHSQARSSPRQQQEAQTAAPASSKQQTTDCLSSVLKSLKGVPDKAVKSQTVSEDAWGDGGDEDDDLLYQVCDVVERLSSSQEEARASAGGSKLAPNYYTRQLSLSPTDCSSAQTHAVITGSWPPAQTSAGAGRPSYSFTRTLSMPNYSTGSATVFATGAPLASGFSAGRGVQSCAAAPSGSRGPNQYKFTQLRNPPAHTQNQQGPANPQGTRGPNLVNAHQPASKRHLHEPRPLANKVFVPNQRPAMCSAAEIERKKQEAIARRKLRVEASQRSAMLT